MLGEVILRRLPVPLLFPCAVDCMLTHVVRAPAGCVQRASCLLLLVHMLRQCTTGASRVSVSFPVLSGIVPTQQVMKIIDNWLQSSGAAAQPSAGPPLLPVVIKFAPAPAWPLAQHRPGDPFCGSVQRMPRLSRLLP